MMTRTTRVMTRLCGAIGIIVAMALPAPTSARPTWQIPAAGAAPRGARAGRAPLAAPAPAPRERSCGNLPQPSDPAVRTVQVGEDPTGVTVDTRTHRAFVINHYGPANSHLGAQLTVSVLDTRSGAVLATQALGAGLDPAQGSHVVATDERTGRVFVLTDHLPTSGGHPIVGPSSVVVLDALTGAVLSLVRLDGRAGALAVDEQDGRVFVLGAVATVPGALPFPFGRGSVSMLDATTGRLLGVTPVGVTPTALAVDARSRHVFVATEGPFTDRLSSTPTAPGTVSILDAGSGQMVETVGVGVAPAGVAVDPRSGHAFVVNLGLGAPQFGFYGAAHPITSSVSILDAVQGTVVLTVGVPQAGPEVVAVAGTGRVFLGTAEGLIILDAVDGARLPLPDPTIDPLPSPTFDTLADSAPVAVDARQERVVLVAAGNSTPHGSILGVGTAFVLDARTGAPLAARPLAYGPGAAAIDPGTGRVFIVNTFVSGPVDQYGPLNGGVSSFRV